MPYKSPPRGLKKKIDYDRESTATDCDEYFDAFDDEEEVEASGSKQAAADLDKQSSGEEASSKIQESEAFELIHDLQRLTPTKR